MPVNFEPGDELCPPWWPSIIWRLHFPHWPGGSGSGGNPVNYPPAIDDIMASLAIHTFSYLQLDQVAAQKVRTASEANIIATVSRLSKLHDENVSRNRTE
jgi:hypothetical protein